MTEPLRPSRREFLRGTFGTAAGLTVGGSLLSTLLASPAAAAPPLVRRDVKHLSPSEMADYVNAILSMKHTTSPWNPDLSTYDQFVWWHKMAFNCDVAAAHMQPSFLPWHRQFLLLFEAQLRVAAGKPIAIPYWDWTDPNSTDAVFSDSMVGGNGNQSMEWALTDGPFQRNAFRIRVKDPRRTNAWSQRWIVRNFGAGGYGLPNSEDIERLMEVPKYDVEPFDPGSPPSMSFRNHIEGWRGCSGMTCVKGLMEEVQIPGTKLKSVLHNGVHLYVGGLWGKDFSKQGTMVFNTSPNDPVFFNHHANVDRLWWEWEQIHGQIFAPTSGLPHGQNLNDRMWPYDYMGINNTIADLLDIRPFNYSYA